MTALNLPAATPARDETTTTIEINGREYSVERTGVDRMPYKLTGKRGAEFYLNRAINAPDMLFGLSLTRAGKNPIQGTDLTDIDGTLRPMKYADWQAFKAAGRVVKL